LKHVKRVFAHLKRPAIRQGSTIASSPSKYFEHIARKRLKVDQARRQSAPPPQLPHQPQSPYQGLKKDLRAARKSSPIRRPPPPTSARALQSIGTSNLNQDRKYDDDDSDEEVENVLITRSSAPLESETENGLEEDRSQETNTEASVNADVDSMVIEEEVEIAEEIEIAEEVEIGQEGEIEEQIGGEEEVETETQFVATQAVQEDLLDRSTLGAFLETQIESQVNTQAESQFETQAEIQFEIQPEEQEMEGTTQQKRESEEQEQTQEGFWGNELESAGGNEAPMNEDVGNYADLDVYAEQEPVLEEEEEEQTQASQALPGRSDAPSPSIANPQSIDDSLYDELLQEADETIDTFEQIIGQELDVSQVPAPRATREDSEDALTPVESEEEPVAEDEVVAQSDIGANDVGNVSVEKSAAANNEIAPQILPRRRGRPPKKKAEYVCSLFQHADPGD